MMVKFRRVSISLGNNKRDNSGNIRGICIVEIGITLERLLNGTDMGLG